MKRNSISLLVLLTLGLFLSCARVPQQLVSEKPIAPTVDLISEKIRDSIVLIESENASGTGFFVAPDKIATNIHIVAHAGPVFVKSPDTKKDWTIEGVVGFDAKNSLVILKLTGGGIPLPLVDSETAQSGESISIPGYPDGEYTVTKGNIQSIRNNNRWLRVDTTTSKETNGSPVFNNSDQVIGVIVPYSSYAVPSRVLEALLDQSIPMEPLAEWRQRRPIRAAAYYSLGEEKLDAEDYTGAIADLDKAIKLNPEYVRAYYERGWAQSNLGDNASAIESCTQAIKIDPSEADAYYGRGTVKARIGKYAEAMIDLDKAIEFDAQHANAYRNRGGVKFKLGESEDASGNTEKAERLYEAAIVDCDKAIQIGPEYAIAYSNRSAAKIHFGDFENERGNAKEAKRLYEGAIVDCNKAIQIGPKYATAYRNRSAAKDSLGDFEGARGNTKEAQRLYEEAIADCNKAIQIDPEYATAYRNRSAAKDSLGDFEGARGNTKEAQRLYEEAIADCNRTIQMDPEDTDAYNNRAIVKCKLADIEFEYGDAEIAQSLYHEGVTDYHKSIQLNNQESTDVQIADLDSEMARNSTVLVLAWSGISNKFFSGSGFFVDKNRIVTNIHVVELPGPIFVKRSDKKAIWAIEGVIAFDAKNDLVVLKVKGEGMPLPLGDSDAVQSGEVIMAVGYPNKKYKVAQGTIHSIRNSDKWIRMNIDTAGGSSGSPVLNSRGQVVGVNVSRVNIKGESYALTIPSNRLKTLLASMESTEPLVGWQSRNHIRVYAYVTQGVEKLEAKRYDEAMVHFDKAIKLNPEHSDSYHKRGRAKSAVGRHKAAIADFDKAIQLKSDVVYVYLVRGNAKQAVGDYEGAIADLDRAIQLYPEHPDLYNDRGEVWSRLGASEFSGGNAEKAQALYEAAIEDYTQAIKLNSEHTEAHNNLGAVKSALSAMLGR